MSDEFFPGIGASALQIGTPAVLSMAPIEGALRPIEEAGLERIREKSLGMTDFIMEQADAELAELGFTIGNPREAKRHGGHVSLRHEKAQPISLALRARGVIPDFRKPDVVRLAPSPLYNTYSECFQAMEILKGIVADREYEAFASVEALVT